MANTEATVLRIEQIIVAAVKFAATAGPIALPVIEFAATFIPAIGPFVPIIIKALPLLAKITQYAPAAETAIRAGKPIFDAIDTASPDIIAALRGLVGIAKGKDAAEVSDDELSGFASHPIFGRPWTQTETQQFFDRFGAGSQS